MVFSSLVFLYFYLPATLAIYYLCPRRFRNLVLFVVSLIFYGWGEPIWISIMIFSCILDYFCSNLIEKHRDNAKVSKGALIASIVGNLGVLTFFKYGSFIVSNIPMLSGVGFPDISLPIGISFYTFQTMSCTIDVYRGEARAQKNPVDFATYVTMFPQLIAGPIVRYKDISEQLRGRHETLEMFASGIGLFAVGLGKKVLLANPFGELWSQVQSLQAPSALTALLGVLFFSFQIYFDFSGYSDMARGLGRMFGFELPINFNYPYISKSITEFWRRWHITLGTWFREYVYIPLGGNRGGQLKTLRNIFIVWFLTGLWHGASWNFVIWGLYYGVLLLIEKTWLLNCFEKLDGTSIGSKATTGAIGTIGSAVKHLYVIIFVMFGWVLFSFTDTASLFAFVGQLFGANGLVDEWALYQLSSCAPLIIAGFIACTPLPAKLWSRVSCPDGSGHQNVTKSTNCQFSSFIGYLKPLFVLLVLLVSTACLVNDSFNPFLYFRF